MTQAAHEGRPIAQRIPAGATEPPIVAYRIPEQKGRTGWSLSQKIGAGAAVAGLLGGALALGSRIGGSENSPPPPVAADTDQAPDAEAEAPQATAPSTPEASPTDLPTIEAEQGSEQYDFTLNAEDYIDKPEQIIVDYYAKLTQLINTGISEGDYDSPERFAQGATDEDFVEEKTAASFAAFTDQMLPAGWENDPELAAQMEYWRYVQLVTARRILLSQGQYWEGAPYEASLSILDDTTTASVSEDASKITVFFGYQGFDTREPGQVIEPNEELDPNNFNGYASAVFEKQPDNTFRLTGEAFQDAG